uniref:High light inducible protein n=1 Tax=Aureoumbra lagunensis TaxID=44058 RepID=A0A7S3NKX5_9STRA|mmetsp:Transcript_7771/g.10831  ORF Transcript_7771/g.10831 Transcript_7771/m.10831 type:complete len:142 (+) Transcript_7771:110-535(+)
MKRTGLCMLVMSIVVQGFHNGVQSVSKYQRCASRMYETSVEEKSSSSSSSYQNPGRMSLDDITLAKQTTALDALSTRWQRQKDLRDWEGSKLIGFSEQAEIINGRSAMFFIVVGLLTEYWTGQSIPEQIATMLRIAGFIEL